MRPLNPQSLFPIATLLIGILIGSSMRFAGDAQAQSGAHVFELRTYTAREGALGDLQEFFRDHVVGLFKKHSLHVVGYWIPQDPPLSQNTLMYIVRHDSKSAAEKNWAAFRGDPEFTASREASEQGRGRLATVQSVFLDPADFSPMQ